MHAKRRDGHRSLLTAACIGAGLRAQGDSFASHVTQKGTVMTIKLEVVDLGDAMVETRQLPILPLFIDSISSFGLLPL